MKTYKKFNFIISYDMADAKRLSKIAKLLEKISIRIQKSIFYYSDVTKDDIKSIVKNIEEIIDEKEDDVRIYKVDINRSLNLNSAIDLKNPNII